MNLTVEQLTAYDHDTVTADNTAGGVPLTSSKVNPTTGGPAKGVRITCDDANVRYMHHPSCVPSTTEGHLLSDGNEVSIYGTNNIRNFKAIRTAGTSAKLRVTYLR